MFYLFLFKDRILPRQLWRKPLRGWFEGWTRRGESLASWCPLRWWSTAWSWHCCFLSLFTLRTFLIVSPNRKISFDSQVTLPVFTTEHWQLSPNLQGLYQSPNVPFPGIPNCLSPVTHNCVTHRELTLQYWHIIYVLPRQLSIFVILHIFACLITMLH